MMHYKRYGQKIFARIDKGEEAVEKLYEICRKEGAELGSISAIGATDDAVIGLFDTSEKKYYKKHLQGDMEIAPLIGNITTMDGDVYLHLHINLGDKENKAYAGHLNSAIISATLEVNIDLYDGSLTREKDETIGLNLVSFDD